MGVFNKQVGMTLLEIMLVLAIGATIIALGLQQYQRYKMDADVERVKANVEMLFQGLANYYKANCRNGNLNPTDSSNPLSKDPYPIVTSSANLLTTNNFLPAGRWPPIPNGLVDATSGAYGYIAQFSWISTSRQPSGQIHTDWATTTTTVAMSVNTGEVRVLQAQVAVKLPTSLVANANAYRAMLGADCVSSASGTTVTPCPTGSLSTTGSYLVWERMPSMASPDTASPYWLTMPRIKEFNSLYTNDEMYGASNSTFEATNYYLCGG